MITIEKLQQIHDEQRAILEARLRESNETTIIDGNIVLSGEYYKKQTRIALKNCGIINPSSLEE